MCRNACKQVVSSAACASGAPRLPAIARLYGLWRHATARQRGQKDQAAQGCTPARTLIDDPAGVERLRCHAASPDIPCIGRQRACLRSAVLDAELSKPLQHAQRWLLSVSASDRSGLLYGIARVLARHHINLQLAKISTLGERVEDTFLIDGAKLQHNRAQIAIESELLDALAPEAA
jgi:predicted amino acid-binding ACT domain protein